MPEIKQPPVYDISHWIDVPDFLALDPMPWLVLTKATEGTAFLDSAYGLYAPSIRKAGIRLGSYHFMQPGDEFAQADWFSEVVLQAELQPDEVLACDLEVGGISIGQVKNFLDRVQLKTGIRPIIYSTEMLLEAMYLTPNIPPRWLVDEWLWIAEYPGNPDAQNSIPEWIVPAGCSINKIALWQYTDDGIVGGIPGNNVDLNLINPTFIQAIGLTEPAPGGETMSRFFVLNTTAANIRTGPGSNHPSRGYLEKGDVVRVDEAPMGGWSPFKLCQKADGSWRALNSGALLDTNNTVSYWSTNAYFKEVSNFPNPLPTEPPPDPEPEPEPPPTSEVPEIPVEIILGDGVVWEKQVVNVTMKLKQ